MMKWVLRALGIREGREYLCLGTLGLNDMVSIWVESWSLVGLWEGEFEAEYSKLRRLEKLQNGVKKIQGLFRRWRVYFSTSVEVS